MESKLVEKENENLHLTELKEKIKEKIKSGLYPDVAVPDDYLLIYLKLTENKSDLSLGKVYSYMSFRSDNLKKDTVDISRPGVEALIKTNMAFWNGQNKKGYPCLIIKAKNYLKDAHQIDDFTEFIIYLFDQGKKEMDKRGVNKFCVLCDREDYDKEKNFNSLIGDIMKKYSEGLTDLLTEHLDYLYIINTSWFWRTMFHIAKKIMSQKILAKIMMLSDIESLKEYFYESNLPTEYK